MKSYIGSFLIMASMATYSSASVVQCRQPLDIWSHHHHKPLVRKYFCEQEVHNADLQMEPEIFYDAHLPENYTYTLFLLENNNNTGSYKIHWLLTDIIPVNKSLTANKTIIEGYRPPMNNATTTYTVLLYKNPHSLHLSPPSHTEMHNFIPKSWAAPIQNLTLENNATFHVLGRNTSHVHPSGGVHPHTSTQTHTPTDTHTTVLNTTTTPHVTPYVTQTITEKKPGYHDYNTTKNNSTNHNSSSHPNKNGAISNMSSLTVMFIPLLLAITKVIY